MAHKRGVLIVLLSVALLLVFISCARVQMPPQQKPTESQNPTTSQPTPPLNKTPWDLKNLTDAEKAKVTQIALDTPEAKDALETYITYKAEFQWAEIVWDGSMIKECQVHILFHFGEIDLAYPEGRYLVDITVDLVNEKVVGLVTTHPLKPLPVP